VTTVMNRETHVLSLLHHLISVMVTQ